MSVGVCFRAKFPFEFLNAKCPREMFVWRFLPFAFHIVFVARTRLLWILGVLIQLRGRPHRRRFNPYWIFPRPAESWFEIHLHQRLPAPFS